MDKILNDFLPDKIFDAHAHLYANFFRPNVDGYKEQALVSDYLIDTKELFLDREVVANFIPFPTHYCKDFDKIDEFIFRETQKIENSVCEITVTPDQTYDELKKRIKGKVFSGFKCYHRYANVKNTSYAEIRDYLSNDVMALAHELNKVITLHLVKDDAILDEQNALFLEENAKKYKNATFILAHAGRAFASRTGVEGVKRFSKIDNIWFDFSAICESPAIFSIINHTGTERSMFGTDYPNSNFRGKSLSIADKFFWLFEKDFLNLNGSFNMYSFGLENILAIRQASIMADLKTKDVEKIFYKNAKRLFTKAVSKII